MSAFSARINKNPVENLHELYQVYSQEWQLVRDCCAGERAVKSMTTMYLPDPYGNMIVYPQNTTVLRQALTPAYARYLQRAVFYNATSKTKDALVGAIFSKEPQVTVPQKWDWFNNDIDGMGTDFETHSKMTCDEACQTGTCGLLVDFPQYDYPLTLANISDQEIHPLVTFYSAESITNWKETVINDRKVLSWVCLKEAYDPEDQDESDVLYNNQKYQYRELSLQFNQDDYNEAPLTGQISGIYTVTIYRDGEIYSQIQPTKWDGSYFNYIPFIPVGAVYNNIKPQKGPLYDIATMNLSHYRTSADLEELMFKIGQPTVCLSGISQSEEERLKENGGIQIGANTVLILPEGGSATILQVSPTTLLSEQLERKEIQMQMIGARLVQQSAGEAAETVRMRQSGEASILATISRNMSLAYEKAALYCSDFMPPEPDISEISIKFNNDFFREQLDPQTVQQLEVSVTGGNLPVEVYWDALRQSEIIDPSYTDEEMRSLIEESNPISQNLQKTTPQFDFSQIQSNSNNLIPKENEAQSA